MTHRGMDTNYTGTKEHNISGTDRIFDVTQITRYNNL